MSRIIEAGHYYQAKGPTHWSALGWGILRRIRSDGDRSMLFIDDVHSLTDMHVEEQRAQIIPTFKPDPAADYKVLESQMNGEATVILERLKSKSHPYDRRARKRRNDAWYCSGFRILHPNGQPTCLLLDAALALKKYKLGFRAGVNVLPRFYEWQQQALVRILAKSLPDFQLSVILFDENGECTEMQPAKQRN